MKKKSLKYKHFVEITQNVCPMLSNYYCFKYKLQNVNKRGKDDSKDMFSRCVFCCSKFSDGNYSVRIAPKPASNKKIKKLLSRHDTDVSNLGKYQTKLVNDYKHGRNTLNITCHVCKKTTKVAGLSRDEKTKNVLRQREKLNLQAELEDIIVPSKKEKKREKKKLQRKRKAAGLSEDDVTAGLILPNTKETIQNSDDIDNRLKPSLPESIQDDTTVKQSTSSNKSKALYKTGTVNEKNTSHRTMSQGVFQRNAQSFTQIQNRQTNKQLVAKSRMNSLSTTLPGVQKTVNKKQKSKKMSKQLGSILKQEREKKTGGSLADFLSSI